MGSCCSDNWSAWRDTREDDQLDEGANYSREYRAAIRSGYGGEGGGEEEGERGGEDEEEAGELRERWRRGGDPDELFAVPGNSHPASSYNASLLTCLGVPVVRFKHTVRQN